MPVPVLRIIIFSLNRAMQLEALLRSTLQKITCNHYDVDIIYNSSDVLYEKGYDILKDKYAGLSVNWLKEQPNTCLDLSVFLRVRNLYRYCKYNYLRRRSTTFKRLVERSLQRDSARFVMFLTDDGYFYRNINISADLFEQIENNSSQNSFSLRMGKNISNSLTTLTPDGAFFSWNYYAPECKKDWAYPFSVDGVIYSSSFLSGLLRKIFYVNPNTLEAFVVEYVMRHRYFSRGYCSGEASYISLPINRVQRIVKNESLDIDPHLLNEKFLEGYQLEYKFSPNPRMGQIYPSQLLLRKGDATLKLYDSESNGHEIPT